MRKFRFQNAAQKSSAPELARGSPRCNRNIVWSCDVLYWALVFLVIALVAGVLGFGGAAQSFGGVARVLFGVFLALFTLSMLAQLLHPG